MTLNIISLILLATTMVIFFREKKHLLALMLGVAVGFSICSLITRIIILWE